MFLSSWFLPALYKPSKRFLTFGEKRTAPSDQHDWETFKWESCCVWHLLAPMHLKNQVPKHLRIKKQLHTNYWHPEVSLLVEPRSWMQCDASGTRNDDLVPFHRPRLWVGAGVLWEQNDPSLSSLTQGHLCIDGKCSLAGLELGHHWVTLRPWIQGKRVSSGDSAGGRPTAPFLFSGPGVPDDPCGTICLAGYPPASGVTPQGPPGPTPRGELRSRPGYEEDRGPEWWACDPASQRGLAGGLDYLHQWSPSQGTMAEAALGQGRWRMGEKPDQNFSKWNTSDFQKG